MSKLVVFRESKKAQDELVSCIERYLLHLLEVVKPFDHVVSYTWNEHRNKMSVLGKRFKAEVVLVPKGIVVMGEIPVIWYPFRNMIEERIAKALDMIIEE
ncbi:MAG: hypothetical protein IT393_04885 [Nitrospirae bacterium]|nr:hypothetical protein [Nitrospirota bacterium]